MKQGRLPRDFSEAMLKSFSDGEIEFETSMRSKRLQEESGKYADEIEAEMRRIGLWQSQAPRPEQMKCKQAFGMDTMTFAKWLQFVFIPRVREAVASNGFPAGSSVGTQAVREFDGDPEAERLVTLLAEFDALFE